MTTVRRLTLQLTPLLDLLLIVMFAQYMQLRIAATQEADRFASEREATTRENEELRQQVDLWESEQRRANQQQQRERTQLGQLVRELFHIPETTINRIIQPRSKDESAGLSPSEIASLKAQFQEMSNSRGDQVVDHLLTFNEMRKQFDTWEFYMNEDGELLITAGTDRQTVKSKPIETPEQFVDTVLKVRKQFPPTKPSVLILCRYGDCRLLNQLAMTRGLPAIAERLKGDGQGTTRFDYAVLGFRPLPELEKR
jgi:hypothetical protein